MRSTETIPVIFASDDYFVPYMSTTIQSILENSNPDRTYSVFILYQNIEPGNIALLKTQISAYQNFSIEFIDVTGYIVNYNFWIGDRKKITKETYFRLLIPYIFTEFEKVLYLDSDMICCADIAELYDMEIGGNMLISTRDICGAGGYYRKKNKKRDKRYSDIGIKNHDDYFIAGLLVFNTGKFRQSVSLRELLDFAVSRNWTWHDQDILNVLCEGKVLFAPIEWDYYSIGEDSEFLPGYWMEQYARAQKNIKIIHFVANHKPWQNPYQVIHFESFWKYATRTPFVSVITGRMAQKGYINSKGVEGFLLNNIRYRQGIGLKMILKCLFAWLLREKNRRGKMPRQNIQVKAALPPLLFFMFFLNLSLGGFPVNAQEALKSIEEDYYDFLAVRGEGELKRPFLNYRTLSDSVWTINENAEHPWQNQNLGTKNGNIRIYGPSVFVSRNTAAPYGQNDGALWQGKGINAAVSGGFRYEKYGWELTFKPLITFSQNQDFDIVPPSEQFRKPQFAGKAENYGYFWREIDHPQRFGGAPFFSFDWGDSEIRFTWKTLTAGLGTQAVWLGPSYLNAILHSNNAPSYPKFDAGIRKQAVTIPWLNWYLGDIEGRVWTGCLSESDYYDNNETNNNTMIHGLSFAYMPSFLPNITFFVNRTSRAPWEPESLIYVIPTDRSQNTGDDDQRISFGFDWLLPQAGFELYAEAALDDFIPGNLLGYIRYPFHTWVSTWGLKKTLSVSPKNNIYGEILFEWTNMEVSQDYQVQWPSSFYFHGSLHHGYTNRGQTLGAGSGWAGNSQYLAFKLYYPKGASTVFVHRNNPDNDFIYGQAVGTGTDYDEQLDDKYFTAFKANFIIGVDTTYFLFKRLSVGAGAAYNLIINPYYFYSDAAGQTFKFWNDKYLHNFSVNFTVQYRY